MKKYSEEIAKRNAQIERRERTSDFLRQSIRNSQKINLLKEGAAGAAGMANGGYESTDFPAAQPNVSLSTFVAAFQRMRGDADPDDEHMSQLVESLGSVVANRDFQKAYKLNQKVNRALCKLS
jgi:hypothetical protein